MGDVKSEPPTDEPEVVEQSAAPTPTHKPASVLQVQDKKKPKVSCCSESAPCAGLCWRHPIFPDLGKNDWRDPNFGRALGAEFTGVMLLVFFGCVSIFVSSSSAPGWFVNEVKIKKDGKEEIKYEIPNPGPRFSTLHVSLAFGLTVGTIAQALGHVSGAHINPAVTFGAMIACKTTVVSAICYIIVQCIGGLAGGLLVYLATGGFVVADLKDVKVNGTIVPTLANPPKYRNWGFGVCTLSKGVKEFDGMMGEFTFTFLLVFTVLAVTDEKRVDIKGSAPLAIGFAVFCSHAAGITFTGCCINPARWLGAFYLSDAPNKMDGFWVYIVGPLLGAFEAGFWHMTIFSERKPGLNKCKSSCAVAPAEVV